MTNIVEIKGTPFTTKIEYWHGEPIWRYRVYNEGSELIYFFTSTTVEPDRAIKLMIEMHGAQRKFRLTCNGYVIHKNKFDLMIEKKFMRVLDEDSGDVYNDIFDYMEKRNVRSLEYAYKKIKESDSLKYEYA